MEGVFCSFEVATPAFLRLALVLLVATGEAFLRGVAFVEGTLLDEGEEVATCVVGVEPLGLEAPSLDALAFVGEMRRGLRPGLAPSEVQVNHFRMSTP